MRNPYLCLAIVGILGLSGLIGVFGIVMLAFYGHEAPQALVAIVSGAFGSLASFLVTPPRGSAGGSVEKESLSMDPLGVAKLEALDRHTRANEEHLVRLREVLAGIKGGGTLVVAPAPPPK